MANFHWLLFGGGFFAAIAIGWALGRAQRRRGLVSAPAKLSRHYFAGLNYLLNEQTDKAIDLFIRLLNVDHDTVEIHLILGNLFRRRGEVDRAIRLHQNLIARPNLNANLRVQAILSLGKDYMAAGVYDRAERLFLEAMDTGNRQQYKIAMRSLLNIYQKEKDWEKAIEYAEQLMQLEPKDPLRQALAHYYSERLEKNIHTLSSMQVKQELNVILQHNPKHVRASILEATWLARQEQWQAALHACQRVISQDVRYTPEIIGAMVNAYQQLDKEQMLLEFLQKTFDRYPNTTTLMQLIEQWQRNGSLSETTELLAEKLRKHPLLPGLCHLLDLLVDQQVNENANTLMLIRELLHRSLKQADRYQCQHCGFKSKTLLWLCPSCQHWNSVIPLTGLEHLEIKYN